MKASKEIKDYIKDIEKLSLVAYKPHPKDLVTIGWGTTRIDGKLVSMGLEITIEQAQEYFDSDIEDVEKSINSLIKVDIHQKMFDALVSLVYNIGSTNFKKSTLLKLINQKKFVEAAEQFPKWKYSAGKILRGLVKRRKYERELFLDGLSEFL